MHDDQQNGNPLDTKLGKLEDLVKDTKEDIDDISRALQEAEENGNVELFLKSQHPAKDK